MYIEVCTLQAFCIIHWGRDTKIISLIDYRCHLLSYKDVYLLWKALCVMYYQQINDLDHLMKKKSKRETAGGLG